MSTVTTAAEFMQSMNGKTTCIASVGEYWGHGSSDQIVDDSISGIFNNGYVGELKELCIFDKRISDRFYEWLSKNKPGFDVDAFYFIMTERIYLLVWEGEQ